MAEKKPTLGYGENSGQLRKKSRSFRHFVIGEYEPDLPKYHKLLQPNLHVIVIFIVALFGWLFKHCQYTTTSFSGLNSGSPAPGSVLPELFCPDATGQPPTQQLVPHAIKPPTSSRSDIRP